MVVCESCKNNFIDIETHYNNQLTCKERVYIDKQRENAEKIKVKPYSKTSVECTCGFKLENNKKHIFKNIYICDISLVKKYQDNVNKMVIGILPKEKFFDKKDMKGMSLLSYKSNKPLKPIYNLEKMKTEKEILIFCYSGYQRTTVFLCDLLNKLYNISYETTLDMVLPKIDKSYNTEFRNEYLEKVKTVLN